MRLLDSIRKQPRFITVVSGLPRSGTSMMMQILERGGIPPITDGVRTPDSDNSKGYYEHEAVKSLPKGVYECLTNAQGCSVKVISTLLAHLPDDRIYKVIFMQRDLDEVLASQKQMLINLGSSAKESNDQKLKGMFTSELAKTRAWLLQQKHFDTLYVDYADVVARPKGQISIISDFLGVKLNRRRALSVVDNSMRHQKATVDTIEGG